MGGYSSYVWSAYFLAGLVLTVNFFGMKRQSLRTKKKLHHWFKSQ
ncbi:MAG: heme exporter protein CcmD [Legionella sp.]|nr:heme exporter protein CcmD [Legionella sp.]